MNNMKATFLSVLAVALAGCAFSGSRETSPVSESAARQFDVDAHESKTLSGLATLENGVHDYIKGEGRIPGRIEDLIPKYLAEIPVVEIAKHSESSKVKNYPATVIRDGVIDGTQLRDTGHWGYAHNSRQVIIFVDCTHIDSHGKPWFKDRGVY